IALYTPKVDIIDPLGNVLAHAEPLDTHVMTTTAGDKPGVYLRGTTYTPTAALNLYVNNDSKQIFNFGVIARSLDITINPQQGGQSLIYTDDVSVASTAVPTTLLLRISVAGIPRLVARVSIPQTLPRRVTVSAWSVQR
ncbi:MAG: hypothetical protein QOI74_1819, partial [Micromonosporaceae bacterium]|nr:hypothetical protein [Micromonosporaceae bacterium]